MYRQGFAVAVALAYMVVIATVRPVQGIPGAGECSGNAGSVMLNSTVMTPAECVALGGDCCNWDGCCWNDGVGAYENPACMGMGYVWGSDINCNGCYKLVNSMSC